MLPEWNADIIIPISNNGGTSVFDGSDELQTELRAGTNVNISNGEISAEGSGEQSDWTEQDSTKESYIKNKPVAKSLVAGNNISLNESGDTVVVSANVPAQVQSDWNQSDATATDYIKNKPTIPSAQVQSDWNQSDNTSVDFIKNKPTIPSAQVQSDWNQSDNTSVDFIKNKPTIPSAQVQSDWNQSDNTSVDFIKNKPTIPEQLTAGNCIRIASNAINFETTAGVTDIQVVGSVPVNPQTGVLYLVVGQ